MYWVTTNISLRLLIKKKKKISLRYNRVHKFYVVLLRFAQNEIKPKHLQSFYSSKRVEFEDYIRFERDKRRENFCVISVIKLAAMDSLWC